jgi:hypothetical protein
MTDILVQGDEEELQELVEGLTLAGREWETKRDRQRVRKVFDDYMGD